MPRKPSQKVSTSEIVRAMKSMGVTGKGAYTKKPVRKSKAVQGRGFYKGFGADLGKWIGKGASALTGIPALDVVGEKLGKWGAGKTGWGEYHLSHNSLVPEVPQIHNPKKEGSTQIRHKEYIGDILSSVAFKNQYILPINAGLPLTFPWASQIAQNFTQYEINGMLFEYVSTSGDATGSNTGLGEIMMSTNYDSVLPAFTNKQQMLNQEFSISCKPSVNAIHAIECAKDQTTLPLLYTRNAPVPTGTDQRMYDLGVFYLATQGNQTDGQVLGELYVTYDILLYKPLLGGIDGGDPTNPTLKLALTNTTSRALPLGDQTPFVQLNNCSIAVDNVASTLTIPKGYTGRFLLTCDYYSDSITTGEYNVNLSFPSTVTGFPLFKGAITSIQSYGSPATAITPYNYQTVFCACFDVDGTASESVITLRFGSSATGTAWSTGDLTLTQIPSNVLAAPV